MPLHRRLPKRGFNNIHAADLNEVNLGRIQEAVDAGKLDANAPVTLEALVAAGILARPRDGVKLLGVGEVTAKLVFEVTRASKSAIEAVEKAGGSVSVVFATGVSTRGSQGRRPRLEAKRPGGPLHGPPVAFKPDPSSGGPATSHGPPFLVSRRRRRAGRTLRTRRLWPPPPSS